MNAGVAGLTDALVFGEAQPVGHRFVDSHHPVLRVQDDNQVRHGVERPLPLLGCLDGGNIDPLDGPPRFARYAKALPFGVRIEMRKAQTRVFLISWQP